MEFYFIVTFYTIISTNYPHSVKVLKIFVRLEYLSPSIFWLSQQALLGVFVIPTTWMQ